MQKHVEHRTVVIKKSLQASVEEVYAAFASVKARSVWAVPKTDQIKYSKSSFRVGGQDAFRCGTPGRLEYKGLVSYLEILKNKRIISTETMFHQGQRISIALLTTEFQSFKGRAEVVITAQICSLDGADMSQGYKQGWTSVLGNLSEYLEGRRLSSGASSK